MKLSVATLLLLSVILMSTFLQFTMAVPPSPAPSPAFPSFCDPKCKIRCSKAGYYQRCYDYCMICCRDCKCVPSGTNGNKSECRCYADKKNTKGTSKCP